MPVCRAVECKRRNPRPRKQYIHFNQSFSPPYAQMQSRPTTLCPTHTSLFLFIQVFSRPSVAVIQRVLSMQNPRNSSFSLGQVCCTLLYLRNRCLGTVCFGGRLPEGAPSPPSCFAWCRRRIQDLRAWWNPNTELILEFVDRRWEEKGVRTL